MARGVVFTFEGVPGFKNALERATNEIRAKVGKLMEETAKDVQATARAYVERSTNGDGDLAEEIIVQGKNLNWRVGISDKDIPSRGGDRVHQRPFIYGAILERGSRYQPAEPFMRPAADAHLPRFQDHLPKIGIVI